MPKRYVFFVNAAYCYGIYRPIQDLIWQRGDEAAWFFVNGVAPKLTPSELLLNNEQEVKNFAPDVMFGAGDWVPYYLPGLKVMLFHGMAINKRADKNDVHYKIRGWYDLFCTHAEKDTQRFSELASQHQNFYVFKTGWPKLDLRHQYQQSVIKNNKKTLFFATTFSPNITCAPIVADELKRIAEEENWRVIATLHPLMDKDVVAKYRSFASENFIFLEPEDDLYQAMAEADVMLCDTSSIMYEFMFFNKPVLTFKTRNPGNFLTDIEKVEDILPAASKLYDDAETQLEAAQTMCKTLNEFNDGKASERVLTALDNILAGNVPPLKKKKPLNLLRKFKLRKRLGYWGL